MRIARCLALSVACLALAAPGRVVAQNGTDVTIPAPRGLVNDFAGVIPADQAARIERLAAYVRAQSGGEIAVVTLPDIGSRDVGDVALRIGREWKVGANAQVGDAKRNTGIVILVVPKETSRDGHGHVSVQTGQGTEGFITDAQAGDIRREAVPLLQQQAYGNAIELMTMRVAQRYAANFGFSLDSFAAAAPIARAPARVARRGGISPLFVIVIFFFLISLLSRGRGQGGNGCLWFLLGNALGGGGSRGGWGGGGFGGGGGGFGGFGGGGGFSGGGSSGSW